MGVKKPHPGRGDGRGGGGLKKLEDRGGEIVCVSVELRMCCSDNRRRGCCSCSADKIKATRLLCICLEDEFNLKSDGTQKLFHQETFKLEEPGSSLVDIVVNR